MVSYLHRKANTVLSDGRKAHASDYHLISDDGKTARCGKVTDGVNGYVIVEKRRVLRSMTCQNCLKA